MSEQLEARIKERRQGRECAQSLLELAEIDLMSEETRKAFCEALRGIVLEHAPLPEPKRPGLVPMDAREAERFEQFEVVPYGKHAGRIVADVLADDPQYLDWLAGGADDFKKALNRYLASNRARLWFHQSEEDEESTNGQ